MADVAILPNLADIEMANTEATDVDRIARLAHEEAEYLYHEYAGTDLDIFAAWYESVTFACKTSGISVRDVMNHKLYEWYYGNALHMIVCFMYIPQVVRTLNGQTKFLSRKQCFNAVHTMFLMIAREHVSLDITNYYDETAYGLCTSLVKSVRDVYAHTLGDTLYPSHLLEVSSTVIYLLKSGSHARTTQNKYVQRYLADARYKKRLKAAANTVIDWVTFWVSEYYMCPYTRAGKRLLKIRARKFAEDAQCAC